MTEIIHLGPRRWRYGARLPLDQVPSLVRTAARAPSVHNTQPWRFCVRGNALELRADAGRTLAAADPVGREMTISCGAALYGLRLAIRRLGYVPAVSLLPDPGQPDLLARVYLGVPATATARELRLLTALPHRHTHRGAFSQEPLPPGLLIALQHDAVAERAALVLVRQPGAYQRLAALELAAGRYQRRHPALRAEVIAWARPRGSTARDGIPAAAYPARAGGSGTRPPGQLPARDFDLGRGVGLASPGGAPAATAILVTAADTPADWLAAGQALQRLLTTAAGRWVFASLSSQVVEYGPARDSLRRDLRLMGTPQLVLQFGRAHTTEATPRRPVSDLLSLP